MIKLMLTCIMIWMLLHAMQNNTYVGDSCPVQRCFPEIYKFTSEIMLSLLILSCSSNTVISCRLDISEKLPA